MNNLTEQEAVLSSTECLKYFKCFQRNIVLRFYRCKQSVVLCSSRGVHVQSGQQIIRRTTQKTRGAERHDWIHCSFRIHGESWEVKLCEREKKYFYFISILICCVCLDVVQLRPPQPAVYLFVLDVSHNAVETGYLTVFCQSLLENINAYVYIFKSFIYLLFHSLLIKTFNTFLLQIFFISTIFFSCFSFKHIRLSSNRKSVVYKDLIVASKKPVQALWQGVRSFW